MIQALRTAFGLPDLRRKMLFTFLILVVYRLAAHVPIPNVDSQALARLFQRSQFLGFLDLLSGGAMSTFSVIAMGVYPYITASIIIQLLIPLIPQLKSLAEEGEAGRRKIEQYTCWLTIPLSFLQAFGQASLLQSQGVITNFGLSGPTLLPTLATIITLTAGTMFAIWLGQLITEQGIGNGLSLIIFGGIVARIPQNVGALVVGNVKGLVVFLLITAVTVAVIIFVQEGQRRIPVQFGRRVVAMRGRRLSVRGGQRTHIPLLVNSAGMIPLIFAQSILIFPATIASYLLSAQPDWLARMANSVYRSFNTTSNFYWILYFLTVVGFTYFYADIIFEEQNLADALKRQGGFIPGIRPGRRTADYLRGVLRRITLVGAIFLGAVALLPWLARGITKTGTMVITSAGLLIVVGVALDTIRQLEAQLLMRRYKGFIK